MSQDVRPALAYAAVLGCLAVLATAIAASWRHADVAPVFLTSFLLVGALGGFVGGAVAVVAVERRLAGWDGDPDKEPWFGRLLGGRR